VHNPIPVGLGIEISLVVLLVLLNGMLAMAELAIVSARPGRLEALAKAGSHGAKVVLSLRQDSEKFLSAIQVGITLVGIFAGAFGGATISRHVAVWLQEQGLSPAASSSLAVAAVVAGITYLSLVIGELVPKQIALRNPEAAASRLAPLVALIAAAAAPVVWLLSVSSRLVLALFGVKPATHSLVTEDDLRHAILESERSGAIGATEREILERAVQLDEHRVSAVMSRRPEVEWLDSRLSDQENLDRIKDGRHRTYPLCDGNIDDVAGIINVGDVLVELARGGPIPWQDLLRPPLYVPENVSILRMLDNFRQFQTKTALVVDEHGSLAGIVTLTDVLRGVTGYRTEEEEEEVVRRDDGSFLIDGHLSLEELAERTGAAITAAKNAHCETVAGFAFAQLGRRPNMGDTFVSEGWQYEVVDVDGRRVDRLLLTKLPPPTL
jgi:putative hemolysin